MKKIVAFLIPVFIFAFSDLKIKIVEEVLTSIFQKEKILVYSMFHIKSKKLIQIKNCKKAMVIIGTPPPNCNKPTFLFSYREFLKDKNAIGALYWRKGRPQLRIKLTSIKKWHLHLPNNLKEYVE